MTDEIRCYRSLIVGERGAQMEFGSGETRLCPGEKRLLEEKGVARK